MFLRVASFSLVLLFLLTCLATAQVGVSKLVPEKYKVAPVAANAKYYVDRDYTIVSLPKELEAATMIMTGNDEKKSTGEGFITFTIDQPAAVYIAHDSRGETAKGGVPPDWLANQFTFVKGWEIAVTDTNMGTFNLWKKDFSAGVVKLGGNADPPAAGQGSMYIVLLMPVKLASVMPSGKLSATWGAIKG